LDKESGLIRGVAFGGNGLTRGELRYSNLVDKYHSIITQYLFALGLMFVNLEAYVLELHHVNVLLRSQHIYKIIGKIFYIIL
jgi:hypothetical protein